MVTSSNDNSEISRKRKHSAVKKIGKKVKVNPPDLLDVEEPCNIQASFCLREVGFSRRRRDAEIYRNSDFWITKLEQDVQNTLKGHMGCVNCASWDFRGKLLASGSDDKTVRIWDPYAVSKTFHTETFDVFGTEMQHPNPLCGEELSRLYGPTSNVFACQFMHHSYSAGKQNYVVAGSNDANVYIWNWESGSFAERTFRHHSRKIVSIDVHPDWAYCILTASSDGTVRKFDIRCSYRDESLNHDNEVGMIIPQQHLGGPVTPRGEFRETLVVRLRTHNFPIEVFSAQFNPVNPNEFVTCSSDGYTRVFDFRKLTARTREDCVAEFRNRQIIHPKSLRPTYATYSSDGTHVLTTNLNGSMYEFDVARMKQDFKKNGSEINSEIPEPTPPRGMYDNIIESLRFVPSQNESTRNSEEESSPRYPTDIGLQSEFDSSEESEHDSGEGYPAHSRSSSSTSFETSEQNREGRDTDSERHLAFVRENFSRRNEIAMYQEEKMEVNQEQDGTFSQEYTGHIHDKTLKSCKYWGHNHVMTGSDDDRIYVYSRKTGKIVNILERRKSDPYLDRDNIINNLVPHPTEPIVVGIGLNHDIHFWKPIANRYDRQAEFDARVARSASFSFGNFYR